MIGIHRHEDPGGFLADAGDWLYQSETEHTLILGIAQRLVETPDFYPPPIYFAVLRDSEGVVGCAYRTPPHKLVMTRLPDAAVPVLVADAAEVYESLPAAMGPEPTTLKFAELWSARMNVRFRPSGRERIHRLSEVHMPPVPPQGFLRPAISEDHQVVALWLAKFFEEALGQTDDQSALAERKLAEGSLWLWDDRGPVSMAGLAGRSRNVARVGCVYTPPEMRRRGYATACVAHLSQHLLGTGSTECCLYTDLSNPTSNDIYRQIGYRPVADVTDVTFLPD